MYPTKSTLEDKKMNRTGALEKLYFLQKKQVYKCKVGTIRKAKIMGIHERSSISAFS